MEIRWKLTENERPAIGTNLEYSEDGKTVEGTMDYLEERTCMMAGIAGGNGYFGEGFATDGILGRRDQERNSRTNVTGRRQEGDADPLGEGITHCSGEG